MYQLGTLNIQELMSAATFDLRVEHSMTRKGLKDWLKYSSKISGVRHCCKHI